MNHLQEQRWKRWPGWRARRYAFASAALLFLVPALVLGANKYWSGTKTWNAANSNWSSTTGGGAGPYTNATFATGDDAIFEGTAGTVTVSAPNNPRNLTFNVTGYTVSSGTMTLNANSAMTVGTGLTATISSIIAGGYSINKAGDGTLRFLTATNTYSGGTTISAGTLQVGDNGTVGTENASALGTGTVTINTGGILWLAPGGTATTYNFANSFSVNGGTIRGEDGLQHLATGGATFAVGASGATVQSTWWDKPVYIDGTITGSSTLTIAHSIAGTGEVYVNVTNSGNTFSGTTTITTTTNTGYNVFLDLDHINALQYSTINFTNGGGAGNPYFRLKSAGATATITGLTGTTGYVRPNTTAGTYTLNINTSADKSYSGILQDNATGLLALTKSGAGFTQTLSGANTYTGLTTISAGTLKVQGVAFSTTPRTYSISSGAVLNIDGNTDVATGTTTINGAGTLRITGSGTSFAASGDARDITLQMSSGGAIDVQSGATFRNGGWQDITWTGNLADLNVDGTFDIWDGNNITVDALSGAGTVDKGINNGANTITIGANNGSATFSGVIQNSFSTLILTKSGTGTQTLSGANTYTGSTTISGGTLQIGAGGTTGAISNTSNITDDATVTFNRSNDYTYSGVISGAGAIIKEGAGTLTLSGNQTHSGLTTVNGGTLRLTGTPTSNARKHVINSGATISIPGRLNLSVYPAGATADWVTINGGTLSTGMEGGSTYGPYRGFTLGALGGTIAIPNTDNANTVPFDCVIAGTGALTKTGVGTMSIWNVANTYSGGTMINAGTLELGNNAAVPANSSAFGTGAVTVNTATLWVKPGNVATTFSYANNFTVNGGVICGENGVNRFATGGGATFAIGASGATIQSTITDRDVYIDGILSGTAGLAIQHGATAGSVAAIHVTNSANTYSGTATVTSSGQNVFLDVDNITAMRYATITLASGGAGVPYLQLGSATANLTTIIAGLTSAAGVGIVNTNTAAGTYTLNVNNAADNTFGGVLANNTGILALTKSGAGTLTLSGTSTYTGATSINAGVLKAGSAQCMGNVANTITVNSGGALDLNSQDLRGYTASININGSVDANTGCIYNSGTWSINNGLVRQIALGSDASIGGAGARIDIARGQATCITGNNHTLTKVGADTLGLVAGTTGTLSALVINGGIVQFDGNNVFGSATITISSGTKLSYYGALAISNNITMNGGSIVTTSEALGIATCTFSGTLALTGTNTFESNSHVFSGAISGTGALTMTGAGTLTLSNTSNSYAGNNTVSSGTLKLGASGVIPDGAGKGNVSLTGTLDLTSYSETINGLSGAGTVTSTSGTPTLTVGSNDQTSTFSGVVQNGTGTTALAKTGSGTLTLSNTSTYTGATTVSAGTLLVTGATNAGSAVGVSSGATLGGTGTAAGAVTMNNGSTLAPGTGGTTIGTLRTGGITFNATSTYSVNLNGTTPTFDSIYSSGTVALGAGNAVLTVASLSNSANGKVYRIIQAATAVTGTFSGKAEASTFVVSGRLLRINYTATTVTLTDVTTGPTPSWSQTSLGTINGGAIGDTRVYLGTTTPNAIIGRNLTDGSSAWSFTTGITSGCGKPTYTYTSGSYVLVAASGSDVVGVKGDGTQHFAVTGIGGAAGTPYIAPDNTNFFVTRPGFLSKRLLSNGSQVAGWDVAVTNLSTAADIVVYSDNVYVATTDGKVHMGDASDFTPLSTYQPATLTGVSINLPLVVSGKTLYITPNNNTLHAVTTSNMTSTKTLITYTNGSANSGPAWSDIDATNDTIYTAAGVYVYLVKDAAGGEKWSFTAAGAVNSGPLVCNNTVYFGANGGYYYALNKATGAARATWPFNAVNGNATSGPWVDVTNSRVIFASTGGDLHAFTLEP